MLLAPAHLRTSVTTRNNFAAPKMADSWDSLEKEFLEGLGLTDDNDDDDEAVPSAPVPAKDDQKPAAVKLTPRSGVESWGWMWMPAATRRGIRLAKQC